MTSSPPTRWWPGRRMVLVPDLGDQLLTPLAVLEELLTDLAAWEDGDAADPFPARPVLRLPAPLAGRVALGAVWQLRAALTPSQCLGGRVWWAAAVSRRWACAAERGGAGGGGCRGPV